MRLFGFCAGDIPIREEDVLDVIGRKEVLVTNRLPQKKIVIEVEEGWANVRNTMKI
jgi:hypothetical protein